MAEPGVLIDVEEVTRATVEKPKEPVVVNGWAIERPTVLLAPRRIAFRNIELYSSPRQQTEEGTIDGGRLLSELSQRVHTCPDHLKYWLANRHLIPKSWTAETYGRPMHVFCAGLLYRNPDKNYLFAPCMRFIDGRWTRGYAAVNSHWHGNCVVAVVKKGHRVVRYA